MFGFGFLTQTQNSKKSKTQTKGTLKRFLIFKLLIFKNLN